MSMSSPGDAARDHGKLRLVSEAGRTSWMIDNADVWPLMADGIIDEWWLPAPVDPIFKEYSNGWLPTGYLVLYAESRTGSLSGCIATRVVPTPHAETVEYKAFDISWRGDIPDYAEAEDIQLFGGFEMDAAALAAYETPRLVSGLASVAASEARLTFLSGPACLWRAGSVRSVEGSGGLLRILACGNRKFLCQFRLGGRVIWQSPLNEAFLKEVVDSIRGCRTEFIALANEELYVLKMKNRYGFMTICSECHAGVGGSLYFGDPRGVTLGRIGF